MIDFQPVILSTADGSQTLRHPVLGDTYHSLRGAVGEAEYVFIRAGFNQILHNPVRVFEVGFGSGLNALLTWRQAKESGKTVDYQTVEPYPVAQEIAMQLNFADAVFQAMHESPWDEATPIGDHFRLTKIQKSLSEIELTVDFDVIYFDAFAPDTQPELWTTAIFQHLFTHTAPGGFLTTYSAKGSVRRALQEAGYNVEKLPGALGKRHMLRARKPI